MVLPLRRSAGSSLPGIAIASMCTPAASIGARIAMRPATSRAAALQERLPPRFVKDLDALDEYDVPAAPVHLSNSTDALQSLELEHRHTLFVLEKLAERRHRFTTVTLLTKNPAALMDERYVDALCIG